MFICCEQIAISECKQLLRAQRKLTADKASSKKGKKSSAGGSDQDEEQDSDAEFRSLMKLVWFFISSRNS